MFEIRLAQGGGTGRPESLKARALVASAFLLVSLPIAASDPEPVLAIKGGTVLTMAGAPIKAGTVLVRGGRIAEVGDGVSIPEGATVVDATGKYVLPGLVDAMTYYGLLPADRNDASNPATPENRILPAYHPASVAEAGVYGSRELLAGGVTCIYIAPGSAQAIGGQGAVVKTSGRLSDANVLRDPASVDMALGDAVKAPSSRMAVASLIRRTLAGARDSLERPEAFVKGPKSAAAEALARVLRREVPARIEADLPDDIRTAVRIADEFGLALVIDGGSGAYRVRELLAEKGIPVVLGPVSHAAVPGRAPQASSDIRDEGNAAMLAQAGVKIALASFGNADGGAGNGHPGRWLLLEAALATGFGLPEDAALKAVTISAAEILGVADRIGTLEKGKDADIVICDGPPLGLKTRVERVFIDGKPVTE